MKRSDGFTFRFLPFPAVAIILYGTYQTVLDRYSVWGDFIFLAALLCFLGFFIQSLHFGRWREAASLALTLPACLVGASILGKIGINGAQFGFWLTYPYYVSQVHADQPVQFQWSEDGVFLGGGWTNRLIFDPTGKAWNKPMFAAAKQQNDAISLGERVITISPTTFDSCDYHTIKKLGGSWYFVQETYGMGGLCQTP